MMITLEEVRELKTTLEKLMLYEGHPRLSTHDFRVMMQLNHMELYISSNEGYDCNSQMGMLRGSIDKCSPEVVEHLKPFVDRHTYVHTTKLGFYDNAKVTLGLLGIILVLITVVYFAVKLIFF